MGSTNNTIEEEEGKQQLSEKERNSPGGCFHKELFSFSFFGSGYVCDPGASQLETKKSIIITAVYNYVAFPSCHDIFHNLLLLFFVQRCQTRV